MTGDKRKFISLTKGKSGDVSFGNDGTARIIDKGTVALKGRAKAQNVLYV